MNFLKWIELKRKAIVKKHNDTHGQIDQSALVSRMDVAEEIYSMFLRELSSAPTLSFSSSLSKPKKCENCSCTSSCSTENGQSNG